MSSKLEELIAKLENNQPYTALTEAQIMEQANRRYQSVYDQKRLSAQQSYESDDAALVRELAGLQGSYDRERAQSRADTQSAYSQAERHSLSRGMQRSSYNSATLSGIRIAGNEALREIDRQQTEQESEIGEKRTLLSRQLSSLLSQYDADQQSDVLAYADELTAREHERTVASQATRNELAMKIYEYQHELEKEAAEQSRWEAEFKAKYATPQKTSGSKKSKTKKKTVTVLGGSATLGRRTTVMLR